MFKTKFSFSHFVFLFSSLFCCVTLSACDNYFCGLTALENGKTQKAVQCFEKSLKGKNSVESFLALKELCKLRNEKQVLKWTKKAYKKGCANEIDVANLYAQALLDNAKYKKAISICDLYLNNENSENSAKLKLQNGQEAWFEYVKAVSILKQNFKKRGSYDFSESFVQYFLNETFFSSYHEEFLNQFSSINYREKDFLLFRLSLYKKDFSTSLSALNELLQNQKNPLKLENCSCAQISDIGKCLLYSDADYKTWAQNFSLLADSNKGKKQSFYFNFYAARFFQKIYDTQNAQNRFLLATSESFTPSTYDNALWYYLDSVLAKSDSEFVKELEKYGPSFNKKDYYSDLFEELFVKLLSSRRWTNFCSLYEVVNQFASEKTKGYYNYIYARLIQEKMATGQKFSSVNVNEIYESVAKNKSAANYYILLSCEQLGLEPEKALSYLYENTEFVSKNEKTTREVEQVLNSALKQKRIKELYTIYRDYKEFIPSDFTSELAKKVYKQSQKDEVFYQYVLRLASNALYSCGGGKNLELFTLYAPKFYEPYIEKYCTEYQLPQDLLYGLIHSESFFNKDVVSFAGAVGLCQLMPSTASDIARKLKMKDFDLTDAQTNIEFGAFYFAEMIRRLDGSVMSAIISYNSGITRVRNWQKRYSNVPTDIFIEMLPISESRGYGKKVLSASAIYGYLYYGKSTREIISALLR